MRADLLGGPRTHEWIGTADFLSRRRPRPRQVRTVDVQRVVDVLDFVSDATMNAIDEALRLHLGL